MSEKSSEADSVDQNKSEKDLWNEAAYTMREVLEKTSGLEYELREDSKGFLSIQRKADSQE